MERICEECGKPAPKSRKLCNSCRCRGFYYRSLKPCGCGCGEMVAREFAHGHHTRLFSSEEQSRRGRMNDGSKQRDPEGATSYRKIKGRHEHRIVGEQLAGRSLTFDDVVHHINGDKRDNRPENLEVINRTEHFDRHRDTMFRGKKNVKPTEST